MVYSLDFVVRDYECDLQGIVNNANYQHYYEHTRHQFLLENNISFAKLHEENIDLIPSNLDLSATELSLATAMSRETTIKNAIADGAAKLRFF